MVVQRDRDPAPGFVWWNITAGVIFGIAALIAAPLLGLEISSVFNNGEGRTTWLTLFAGVFLTGCFFWWLLMSRPRRFSLGRGAITGILTAFFSYPVVLSIADAFQRNWFGSNLPTFSDRVDNVLLVTGLTLMTTGFAATLILAGVGMLATWILVRIHPVAAASPARDIQTEPHRFSRVLPAIATIAATVVLLALTGSFMWLSLTPIDASGLSARTSPNGPAKTYEEAIAAYEVVKAREADEQLHDSCHSTLLTHGSKVARTVIYFHGFTSCPAQGAELAKQLYDRGYNVYLPRMFGHGEADPTRHTLSDLTAEHLVDMANESVDMAQGLGDEVVVIGLSAGGTVASWTAQYRGDVDHSIAVSPFFGPYVVPPWANHAATNLVLKLPNLVLWWNPLENVAPQRAEYPFALPATHALAEIMRLGFMVSDGARTTPPAAHRISMLLNDADVAVSNAMTQQVIASWREHGQDVAVKVLPFSRHLPHDIINPRERGADIDLAYSTLIDIMDAKGP